MIITILLVLLQLLLAAALVTLIASVVRKYQNPEKSLIYCLLNTILGPVRFLRLYPYKQRYITIDGCLKKALKATKLSDLGGTEFLDSYRKIMELPFHKKQVPTNIGYLACELELFMIFASRLKKIQYLKENPNALKVPVREPVFVTGLPRTGTTFLHRLLSLDPQTRAPLLWELVNSIPIAKSDATPAEKEKCRRKRREFVVKRVKESEFLGDNAMKHIHEIGADLPEECLMAMREEVPLTIQHLMSLYMDFDDIVTTDLRLAYTYYKKVLQILSYQIDEERVNPRKWILKCPMHMIYIKELASVFQDAKIIWTHRHPVSAVPSMCSLLKSCHQTYFEKEGRDDAALGKQLKHVTSTWLEKAPKDFAESKLVHQNVIYNNLISNPIDTVKNIYSQFKWKFTPEYESILKEHLDNDKREREALRQKKGTQNLHTYEPAEFGLTEQELCEGKFKEYVDKYNLPMSRN